MAGQYEMYVKHGTPVMALDEDGGSDIADYALSHGVDAAVDAFLIWLSHRVKDQAAEREAAKRRKEIKIVRRGRK
jgi:hypothetical protein